MVEVEAVPLLHAQAKEVDLQALLVLHQAQMVVVVAGLSRVGVTEAGLSRVGVTEAGLTRVQRARIIMSPKYALT